MEVDNRLFVVVGWEGLGKPSIGAEKGTVKLVTFPLEG